MNRLWIANIYPIHFFNLLEFLRCLLMEQICTSRLDKEAACSADARIRETHINSSGGVLESQSMRELAPSITVRMLLKSSARLLASTAIDFVASAGGANACLFPHVRLMARDLTSMGQIQVKYQPLSLTHACSLFRISQTRHPDDPVPNAPIPDEYHLVTAWQAPLDSWHVRSEPFWRVFVRLRIPAAATDFRY